MSEAEVLNQLLQFGYSNKEIISAIRQCANPYDLCCVLDYIEKQRNKQIPVSINNNDDQQQVPKGWTKHITTDGTTYYQDNNTKTTHWELPKPPSPPPPQPQQRWTKHITNDGRTYWQDHITKTTQWTLPQNNDIQIKYSQNNNVAKQCMNNNDKKSSKFYCICGQPLQETKIIYNPNVIIICDCCLQQIKVGDISYQCYIDYSLHEGGFDLCSNCINSHNINHNTPKGIELNAINDQIEKFKNVFSLVSIDGVIDVNGISKLFPDLSYHQRLQFIANYDENNDGVIDFKEFSEFLKPFILGCDLNDDDEIDIEEEKDDNAAMAVQRAIFDEFSINGYITQNALQEVMNNFAIYNANINDIMKQFDDDNNGKIDFNEFCQILKMYQSKDDISGANNINMTENTLDMTLFAMFDDDGNNIIDADELILLLSVLGNDKLKYLNIDYLINKFDNNNKGGVNFNEFKDLCKSIKRTSSHDILATFKDQISNSSSVSYGSLSPIEDEKSDCCSPQIQSPQQIIYVVQQPIFQKVTRFAKTYSSSSIKLNVAVILCVKKLLFGLQCYIAEEINNEKAKMFDRMVCVYNAQNKATDWIKSKINWDDKKIKLLMELGVIMIKIGMDLILPGSSCIFHFISAAKKLKNGNKKGALFDCALGVASILTAGFIDYGIDFAKLILNGLEYFDVLRNALSKFVKQLAFLLKPLFKGFMKYIVPFINIVGNDLDKILSNFGISNLSQLYKPIMKGVNKLMIDFSAFMNELVENGSDIVLDDNTKEEIKNIYIGKVNKFITDIFGEHVKTYLVECVTEFCFDKFMKICKDKIKDTIHFGSKNNGIVMGIIDNGDDEKLNENEIQNDKQNMINDVGIFIKNIDWKQKATFCQLSDIKLFNKNGDTMIYISIKRSLYQHDKKYIKAKYKIQAYIECLVMFAGNDEAKRQLLTQKLMK